MERVLILCLLLCAPVEGAPRQLSGDTSQAEYERLEIRERIESTGARTMRLRALLRFNTDAAVDRSSDLVGAAVHNDSRRRGERNQHGARAAVSP